MPAGRRAASARCLLVVLTAILTTAALAAVQASAATGPSPDPYPSHPRSASTRARVSLDSEAGPRPDEAEDVHGDVVDAVAGRVP